MINEEFFIDIDFKPSLFLEFAKEELDKINNANYSHEQISTFISQILSYMEQCEGTFPKEVAVMRDKIEKL